MHIKRFKILLITVFVLSTMILSANLSLAQGLTTPCNGGDPDVDCPIDDGIFFLVWLIIVFVIIKKSLNPTYKKQIVEFKPD